MNGLLELAMRCELAAYPSKALDREIALAVGWVRLSPSQAGRSNPAWYHPDDCRDGKPVLDSLHGTDVWRDPISYTASLDAAITLVPGGLTFGCGGWDSTGKPWAWVGRNKDAKDVLHLAEGGATPALALCAAALRAHAAGDGQ